MAAANLIAAGSTAANSGDFDVAAGSALTIALKGVVDATAEAWVGLKDDTGAYQKVGALTNTDPVLVITAPGTYCVFRKAGQTCGVFRA